MQRVQVDPARGFHVIARTSRAQAATMVIQPGESEGGSDNTHDRGDQWLYVISGAGEATVSGSKVVLEPGTLLLIERGEPHEVRASKGEPLRTLNFYAPPEY